jgi:hypothetical protein
MIEDRPPRPGVPRDLTPETRTLAELAASVMSSQQFVVEDAADDAIEKTESSSGATEAPTPASVVVTSGDSQKATRRRLMGAIVLPLIILAMIGVAWLHSTLDSSAPASPAGGELVAPPDGGPPGDGTAPPSSNEALRRPLLWRARPSNPVPATAQEPPRQLLRRLRPPNGDTGACAGTATAATRSPAHGPYRRP